MKLFLAKVALFIAIILGMQAVLFLLFLKKDIPDSVQQYRRGIAEGASCFYFGDSVVIGKLSGKVQEFSGERRMVSIARGAFQAEMYDCFCEAIVRHGVHPRKVIVPINMRSFSEGWLMNPYYQCEKETYFVRHDSFLAGMMFRPLSVFKALNLHRISQIEYESATVKDGEKVVGKIYDFDNPDFDICSDENLRKKLVLYYMEELRQEHPYLHALGRIARAFDPSQTRVIFYITPIDYKTGVRYLGERFRCRLAKNVGVVQGYLQHFGLKALDLSQCLPSDAFRWRKEGDYPNEHLNDEGIRLVALRLAERLRE